MSEEETKDLIREVRKHFVIPLKDFHVSLSVDATLAELDAVTALLQPRYRPIFEAFRHSMASTIFTVSMPFSLASASAMRSHFQRFHIAERIRAQTYKGLLTEGAHVAPDRAQEEAAHSKAHSRMIDFVQTAEGVEILVRDTARFLLSSLEGGTERAPQELLNQGIVLLWSAFEVLCRDTFEAILNADPARVKTLMDDPVTRRRFEPERLPLDTLLQHGFDLSATLGTVLVTQRDFSDLPTAKAVYSVLFPNCKELHEALSHRELWTLFKRRHLVVHRRCVIDQSYLDATGENLPVGTALKVAPNDFEGALDVVISTGATMARSISANGLPQ